MEDPTKMPEEWLKFITKERRCYDGPSKYKFWMNLYRRAVKEIPVDEYGHNNAAYAKILVDFAKLQARTSEDEARSIFQAARNNVKHCSLVYVAWAQFELLHNNPAKCKKLLNKGKQFLAEPKCLLDMALANFANGNNQLIDEETEEHTFTELINKTSSNTPEDDVGGHLRTNDSGSSDSNYSSSTGSSSPEDSRAAAPVSVKRDTEVIDGGKHEEILSKPATSAGSDLKCIKDKDLKSVSKAIQEPDSFTFSLPVIRSKLCGSTSSSSSSSNNQSSDEIDSLSLLFNRNKVSMSNKENQAPFSTPQAVKGTPQSSSVSTSKYPVSSSSISDHKRSRSHKCLGFVGLPRRVPLRTKEEEDVDEYRDADDPERGEKPDRKISRNLKEEVSVDGVFPFREVLKSTETKEQPAVFGQRSTKIPNTRLSIVSEEAFPATKRRVDQTQEKHHLGSAASTPQHQPNSFPAEIQPRQPCPIPAAATSYKQERGHAELYAANSHKRQTEQHNARSYPVSSGSRIPAPGAPVSDPGSFAPHGVPASLPISAPFASNNILFVNGKAYNKLNTIGKGGSSKVYSAFDGEKTCAIKYVNVEDADSAVIQSYINEITLLKRLQGHGSIIKLYDWEMDEVGKVIKLVLEIGCIDLAGYLRKNPEKITPVFIKLCWKQILDAVQVVHDEGIVHSDLKPANFLLVEGNLKLIDFGIANAIQGDTTSFLRDSQIGTLNYMSPEALKDISQSQGPGEHHKPIMKIGRASDVWSLGCILYVMVHRKTPFQHISNHMQKWQCIMDPTYEIKFPRIENQDLVDTMKGCLRRNPKERYTIPQLQNHPFLTGKTKAQDVETVLNCIMQMKEITSPTTLRTLTQNMLEQLSSGGSLDMASIQPSQRSSQPSRQPLYQNISSSVAQERKNKFFAGSREGYKENVVPKASR